MGGCWAGCEFLRLRNPKKGQTASPANHSRHAAEGIKRRPILRVLLQKMEDRDTLAAGIGNTEILINQFHVLNLYATEYERRIFISETLLKVVQLPSQSKEDFSVQCPACIMELGHRSGWNRSIKRHPALHCFRIVTGSAKSRPGLWIRLLGWCPLCLFPLDCGLSSSLSFCFSRLLRWPTSRFLKFIFFEFLFSVLPARQIMFPRNHIFLLLEVALGGVCNRAAQLGQLTVKANG